MKLFKMLPTMAVLMGLANLAGAAQNLVDIYRLASQNDPLIHQYEQNRKAAGESVPIARSKLFPTITAQANEQASDNRIDYHSMAASTAAASRESMVRHWNNNQISLGLSINQPIWHRETYIQIAQADDQVAQAEAQFYAAEQDLMLRAYKGYFAVLSAYDDLRTRVAEREANQRQYEQADQRFQVGLSAITDVYDAKSVYERSRADVIVAENALDDAKVALGEIIGTPVTDLIRLGDDVAFIPPDPQDIEKWAVQAREKNWAIMAAAKQAEIAKKTIEINRSSYYPRFDAVGNLLVQNSSAVSIAADQQDRQEASVGVQMAWSFYTGGEIGAKTNQAAYQYQGALEALEQKRRDVDLAVRQAYRGVLSSISQVAARQAAREAAASAMEASRAGFDVGIRTMVDVLAAMQKLYGAERDYSKARYDYIFNGALLYQASSQLSPDLIEKVNTRWLTGGSSQEAARRAYELPKPERDPEEIR
ncbi:MAG: TolC family outer membrane protein, partial [Pseudomonadota bacterium]